MKTEELSSYEESQPLGRRLGILGSRACNDLEIIVSFDLAIKKIKLAIERFCCRESKGADAVHGTLHHIHYIDGNEEQWRSAREASEALA